MGNGQAGTPQEPMARVFSAVANLITAKVEVAVFTASDGTKPESSRFEASGVAKTTA